MSGNAPYTMHELSIGYGNKTVAQIPHATLRRGALTLLVGRNGAGKSTLLRTLAALQPPLSGQMTIGDVPVVPGRMAKEIGIVLTDRLDIDHLTVYNLVAMGRAPYTGYFGRLTASDRQIIDHSLSLMGMADFAQRLISSLSDGERQKVMIAKALAQQTPYILLDEPTAFLDYPSKQETMRLLLHLAHHDNKAILISTHDLDIALRHCDEVWHLHDATLHITTDIPSATHHLLNP